MTAVRLAIAIAGLLFAASVAAAFTYRPVDTFGLLVNAVPMAAFLVAGAIAVRARPSSRPARWLLATGVAGSVFIAAGAIPERLGAVGWWLFLLGSLPQCLFFAFWLAAFTSFPDPALDRRYETVVIRLGIAGAVLLPAIAAVAQPRLPLLIPPVDATPTVAAPVVVPFLAPLGGAYQLYFVLPVLALVLLVLRYRRADPARRAVMRWPLFACAVAAVFFGGSAVYPGLNPYVGSALFELATTCVPVALGIALVRPQLLDIDLVIRRSPVYALLWLAIALAYAVLAGVLGLTASQRLPVASAVAVTLVAAVLFQPARTRLERLADRVVFGERLDGYRLLSDLGRDLEHAPHGADVGDAVARALVAGIGARWARVVGVDAEHETELGVAGAPVAGPPALTAALVNVGEAIGRLECGPRADGAYSRHDRELLATVARQVTLAISDQRKTRELAASRTRLVQAAAAERRRLERDLHDGVQQHLVALIAKIEVARRAGGGDGLDAVLTEAKTLARDALTDLRELGRGLHPPVLADEGLVEAIRARAAALPLGVHIEVDPSARGARFSPDVEAAAYFVVAEALTNAVKHSRSADVWVCVSAEAGTLAVVVDDAGIGVDLLAPRRGLLGLEDRVAALGGSLEVTVSPAGGARVRAVLPT